MKLGSALRSNFEVEYDRFLFDSRNNNEGIPGRYF